MAKYIKKPVVIEAVQFLDDSETLLVIQEFMGNADLTINYRDFNDPKLKIETFQVNI
jgi:hypothetical protein